MTITRRRQSGAEAYTTLEWDSMVSMGFGASGEQKTGSFCWEASVVAAYGQWNIAATRQIRVGGHFKHAAAAQCFPLTAYTAAVGELIEIEIGADNLLKIQVNNSIVATSSLTFPINSYRHLGIDIKVHSSAGWVNVYLDGVLAVSYSGNTGNADIEIVRLRPAQASLITGDMDDVFLDDTAGESAAVVVPDLRFPSGTPNAAGNYNETTTTGSASRYANVDERPPNTTDYNEATALDQRETYNFADPTLPQGCTINALIPWVVALRTDGAVDTKLNLMLREGGSDAHGSDLGLSTSNAFYSARFTTKPSGGAWDATAVNGTEFGWRGRGTF